MAASVAGNSSDPAELASRGSTSGMDVKWVFFAVVCGGLTPVGLVWRRVHVGGGG